MYSTIKYIKSPASSKNGQQVEDHTDSTQRIAKSDKKYRQIWPGNAKLTAKIAINAQKKLLLQSSKTPTSSCSESTASAIKIYKSAYSLSLYI